MSTVIEVKLTRGKIALVDEDVYIRFPKRKWYCNSDGYASAKIMFKHILMHRLVMGLPKEDIDHINGDKLDNRRCNLRLCSHSQNSRNRIKSSHKGGKKLSSVYKGVGWITPNRKWRARITVDGKLIPLGFFTCEHQAAKAYNQAAIKYFGDFAKLNEIVE